MLLNGFVYFGIINPLKERRVMVMYIKNSTSPIMKMKVLSDMSEKKVNENLTKYNLTFSQSRVMNALYNSDDGEYTFKELEKIFHVSQQTMAGLIQRLEIKGFVTSFTDRADRRIKRVRLTDSGRRHRQGIQKEIASTEQWLSGVLEDTEKETLLVILDKIYENII